MTSTLVIQQGSRLLKTIEDDPLKADLAALQRRLARKIELISPILESLEFQYTRGNTALETVVRIGRGLREDVDALAIRCQNAAGLEEQPQRKLGQASLSERRAELLSIQADMKHLMLNIDDIIPSVNLWVSAIGGIQKETTSFSPSRLLQASMLVNVGDTQYIIDPYQPMQIGPDFVLSLYMLFRGHASAQNGEAYGVEEGQRKPTWQEVIHKARVRLYRIPPSFDPTEFINKGRELSSSGYAYQLQLIEDMDDGRVHTFEDGSIMPGPYDGISLAGIREEIPVGQIAKMFYADVGRILNISNDDGTSSNPVLLLKRDLGQLVPETSTGQQQEQSESLPIDPSLISDSMLSDCTSQDGIDRQLREESQAIEKPCATHESNLVPADNNSSGSYTSSWSIPHHLDPEWLALEVFEVNHDASSSDEDPEPTPEEDELPGQTKSQPPESSRNSVDNNLMAQLQRMTLASGSGHSSRPSSSHSQSIGRAPGASLPTELTQQHQSQLPTPLSPALMDRSPFGAIKTSLSLLEMLLRLASLQEFEQTTHLAIPDHVLRFYLDESASESGLYGKDRWASRAQAAQKMGLNPREYVPGGHGGSTGT